MPRTGITGWIGRHWKPADVPFSITETAKERASLRRDQIASRPFGLALLALCGGASGVVVGLAVDWPIWGQVLIGAAAAVAGVSFALLIIYTGCLAAAPVLQRNESRRRLVEIKDAKSKYQITPVDASWTHPGSDNRIIHLRSQIKNDGRGAWFSVVLERLEGPTKPLVDPSATLYWMDRPGVDEEITPDEMRNIGVAVLSVQHDGLWSFRPMSATGPREGGPSYTLQLGRNVAWLRVSARRDPGIDYYRRFGVLMTMTKSAPPRLDVIEPSIGDAEHAEDRPTFERLLDF